MRRAPGCDWLALGCGPRQVTVRPEVWHCAWRSVCGLCCEGGKVRAERADGANFEVSASPCGDVGQDLTLKLRKCYPPQIGLKSAEMFTPANPTTPLVVERAVPLPRAREQSDQKSPPRTAFLSKHQRGHITGTDPLLGWCVEPINKTKNRSSAGDAKSGRGERVGALTRPNRDALRSTFPRPPQGCRGVGRVQRTLCPESGLRLPGCHRASVTLLDSARRKCKVAQTLVAAACLT